MLSNLLQRVVELWCGLRGHDDILVLEPARMYVRCMSCLRESHGWEVLEKSA